MRQRGRKSVAANVVALDVTGSPPRLTAPPGLSKAEQATFNELIANCDPRHFVKSDLPLLVSFVQITVMARRTAKRPGLLAAFERAVKLQATLATRLRLAPQARLTCRTAGRYADTAQGPGPWVRQRP